MMEWETPELLYLILPCCVAWLILALVSDRRRQRAREAFVARAMWDRILPEDSRIRFWSKQLLRVSAIVASLAAMAEPRFGTEIEKVIPRGSDLYVLIDVSRSMLAEDVTPSRLGRAKADVSALLNRLDGERVGLIAFAGQAVVKCPLTVDYDSFRRALQELDPSSAPRGGTAIGDAIRKSLEVFQSKVERDQAILLITDGDDQQSYPLEAATVAADHNVTIFTVGLGDAEQGARIPQQTASKNYVEYQGEQVWSKMDGNLLGEIALKTSGVYVPAGTKAYDLGELYSNHLQNRRARDQATQERSRRSEQYQIFLAIAFIALLIDLLLSPYRRANVANGHQGLSIVSDSVRTSFGSSTITAAGLLFVALPLLVAGLSGPGFAVEPYASVREGLKHYSQEKYDVAQEKFSAAIDELEKQKSEHAAVAAFDEACAYHRRGETEKARESYLRAGLSKDRSISVAAHFNLGNLTAEKARNQAGEQPELVEPDKRKEIVDLLMQATASYRHCLELHPEQSQARSNLELVRLWVKYYADRWRERDRQKRRDESNLFAFLEYLLQAQSALKATVEALPGNFSADGFAELKQTQAELAEEIPTLQDKIDKELRPSDATGQSNAGAIGQEDSKELEEGIRMLQSWAGTASENMFASSKALGLREAVESTEKQQLAIDELAKIWEAVIPFHPLLAKELAEQTSIAKTLNPNARPDANSDMQPDEAKPDEVASLDTKPHEGPTKALADEPQAESNEKRTTPEPQELAVNDVDFVELTKVQEKTLRRARLLAPRAEIELEQLESQMTAANDASVVKPDDPDPSVQASEVDPEEMKAGFQKAIELAPKAVEHMEAATKHLKQKNRTSAAKDAEDARRILEEIQKAQPKNKNDQQDQDQKEQEQNQKDDQQQGSEKDKEKDENKDQQKPDEKQQEENESESKKEEDNQGQKDQQQQAKVSPDRIEEALRKVRERQEEKREKDREFKAQILGRLPVDKDW